MSLAVRVEQLRRGPFGNALAFFNVAVGQDEDGDFQGALILRDFALKQKTDGSAFYFQAPSKLRKDKAGNPVKNDKGFNQYDDYIRLFSAPVKGGEAKITQLAWSVRDAIIEQATAAYEASETENAGRGAKPAAKTPAKATPAKAAAKASVPAKKAKPVEPEDESDESEDDDLPF